jgi:hypothetical protein
VDWASSGLYRGGDTRVLIVDPAHLTPRPSLAALEQLRAFAWRKAEPIRRRDVRRVRHDGPRHHRVLANGGIDGGARVPQRQRGGVSMPQIARQLARGIGIKEVEKRHIVIDEAAVVHRTPDG